ncbi:MAG: DNA repair protein RadA [Myxococcales bacterium]|nr:MAG: DNA repair protein RadA [Myxococcales bacterium]
MAAKAKQQKSVFVCRECGASSPKWLGRCPSCGEWSSLVEERISRTQLKSGPSRGLGAPRTGPRKLSDIDGDTSPRLASGLGELDRVLGGGLVPGAVMLLGGDPGIGKSTLLMQVVASLAQRKTKVLYLSGEESETQIALRAKRICGDASDQVWVFASNSLNEFEALPEEQVPEVMVVDSVQTLRAEELESAAGSVSQLREVTARLVDYAKSRNVALFLVGHVTKDGMLAGPKVLEHLVDTVLSFEGDKNHNYRILRSVKNRFGPANELAIYNMSAEGLAEVPDPSALFLAERNSDNVGSVVFASAEGSRPLLVEIQALLAPAVFGGARRVADGLDTNRLSILLAVLERKAGLSVLDRDVFVSVAGGLKVDEPAMDLALCTAIVSSLRDVPVPRDTVVLGELGLTGEVRSIPRAPLRLAEAAKLGFRRAIVPASTLKSLKQTKELSSLHIQAASTLQEALELIF